MALLTLQTTDLTGQVLSLTAAAGGGDTFPNDGRTVFVVNNGSGSSINVTILSNQLCNQGFDHDVVVAVGAGVQKAIGPFDVGRFGNPVSVTYSAVTSVTVAARQGS